MTDHKWTLPSSEFPEQDHDAFLVLSDGRVDRVTIYGYARTWSMFLAAVSIIIPGFLQVELTQRITAENIEIFVRSLLTHLRPVDVVSTSRALKTCTKHLFGNEYACINPAIKRVQLSAEESDDLSRLRNPLKMLTDEKLQGQDRVQIERLKISRDSNGKMLAASTVRSYEISIKLYLGILERNDIEWSALTEREILSEKNMSLVIREWCSDEKPWEKAQRINALACAFQHLFDPESVSDVFAAAAKLRALNPDGNSNRNHHEYVSLDKVMEEDRKRLEFSLKKSWGRPFIYGGKESRLKYRPSREATAQKCWRSLRAMTTIMEMSAPEMMHIATEERDYKKIIDMFAAYYVDNPLSAQIAALDGLRSLLVRILPKSTDLRTLRRKIRNIKRRLSVDDLVVHDIHPDEILRFAISIMDQSYRRFVALNSCKMPYCNPAEYALRYRTALQIGLLAHNPLRLRSLYLLDIGEFDRKSLGKDTKYFVRVPKEKMKMGIKHDFLLESVLTPWIDRYLHEMRTSILPVSSGNDRCQSSVELKSMWISKRGNRMSRTALSLAVSSMMGELCGFHVNIQLFRRFVATAEIGTQNGSKRLGQLNRMSRKAYEDTRKAQNVDRTTSLQPLFGELLSLRPESSERCCSQS